MGQNEKWTKVHNFVPIFLGAPRAKMFTSQIKGRATQRGQKYKLDESSHLQTPISPPNVSAPRAIMFMGQIGGRAPPGGQKEKWTRVQIFEPPFLKNVFLTASNASK